MTRKQWQSREDIIEECFLLFKVACIWNVQLKTKNLKCIVLTMMIKLLLLASHIPKLPNLSYQATVMKKRILQCNNISVTLKQCSHNIACQCSYDNNDKPYWLTYPACLQLLQLWWKSSLKKLKNHVSHNNRPGHASSVPSNGFLHSISTELARYYELNCCFCLVHESVHVVQSFQGGVSYPHMCR